MLFLIVNVSVATEFQELISRMPGGAMPVVGDHGRVLEYPKPFPHAVVGKNIDKRTVYILLTIIFNNFKTVS